MTRRIIENRTWYTHHRQRQPFLIKFSSFGVLLKTKPLTSPNLQISKWMSFCQYTTDKMAPKQGIVQKLEVPSCAQTKLHYTIKYLHTNSHDVCGVCEYTNSSTYRPIGGSVLWERITMTHGTYNTWKVGGRFPNYNMFRLPGWVK